MAEHLPIAYEDSTSRHARNNRIMSLITALLSLCRASTNWLKAAAAKQKQPESV